VNTKRIRAIDKYEDFLDGIAETNATLGLLLPHLIYAAVCLAFLLFAPNVTRHAATESFLLSFVSLFYPVFGTIHTVELFTSTLHSFFDQSPGTTSSKAADASRSIDEEPMNEAAKRASFMKARLSSPSMIRIGGGSARKPMRTARRIRSSGGSSVRKSSKTASEERLSVIELSSADVTDETSYCKFCAFE
jgi:hypothetical protein